MSPLPARRDPPLVLGFFSGLALVLLVVGALDLTVVDARYAYALAALAASRALASAVAARRGESAGVATKGAGWAALLLLGLAPLNAPYSTAAPGGAALVLAAFLFAAARRAERALPWDVAGLTLLALAYPLLRPLPPFFRGIDPWRFDALYAIAIAAVLGTRIAQVALKLTAREPGAAASAVVESGVRNLAVAVPFASYGLFRGALEDSLRHFEVYEWSLGVALAAYLATAVRGRFREATAEEPWSSEATRHAQRVTPKPDPRFARTVALFEAFVERGERREEYGRFWRDALARSGVAEADAAPLLERAAGAPAPPPPAAIRRRAREVEAASARDKRVEAHRALLARAVERSELGPHAGRNDRKRRVQSHPR